MRIVFAAGGTGGHILPALSVADELRSRFPTLDALFIGTRVGLEAKLVPDAGYHIRYISARGIRGKGTSARIRNGASIACGFAQSLGILSRFKPDVVFGSGGYASAAVVCAASFLRKMIVLQEQNSIPGLTNRLLARSAKRVYLGFERAAEYFGKHSGVLVTGNPLRAELLAPPLATSKADFGLNADAPVLLVFGGSQGAHTLNRFAAEYLLERPNVQAIVQTGEQDYRWVKERLGETGRIFVAPYIAAMHRAYGAADAALARAGALSVSELAVVGLPSILVPYPFAADNHQYYNAVFLADVGGAVVIRDRELNGGTLAAALDALLLDPARRAAMKRALEKVARRDAAKMIADDMETLISAGGRGSIPACRPPESRS
jgi:UDP-N-acetylglucosamine--N-acetylmuramyl-(pentapeptide) pyrophosphoryl-undecaprenol N-acetylglucosamine transferase